MTQILVYGSIFRQHREWIKEKSDWFGKLVSCPMCTGFWVGAFLFGVNGLTELFNFEYNYINILLLGCLASGTSYILSTLFGDDGVKNEIIQRYTRNKN
tara:strand:- start:3026 stop:3322 length:297 start_codon:yes stop_codon:yes gene_type:complete